MDTVAIGVSSTGHLRPRVAIVVSDSIDGLRVMLSSRDRSIRGISRDTPIATIASKGAKSGNRGCRERQLGWCDETHRLSLFHFVVHSVCKLDSKWLLHIGELCAVECRNGCFGLHSSVIPDEPYSAALTSRRIYEDFGIDYGAIGRKDFIDLLFGNAGVKLADIEVSMLDIR